jgi:hypothetical protein
MAARSKYITTTVDEETWRGVIDAGNLWGDSISLATYKLIQRGISSLDKELGSKTPVHITLSRIDQDLKTKMSTKQTISNSYRLAQELNDEEAIAKIRDVAERLGIEL